MIPRRTLLKATLAGACACPLARAGSAAPPRPTGEILVPFGPGGTLDILGRTLAAGLAERLQRPLVVLNLPGAGGAIAIQHLLAGPADGTRLLLATFPQIVIAPLIQRDLRYRYDDFAAIGQVSAEAVVLMASLRSRIDSPAALRKAAQARGGILVGTMGAGSAGHVLALAIQKAWHVELSPVFYKDNAQLRRDLAAGELDLAVTTIGNAAEFHRAGESRAIAVASADASGCLPGLPTLASEGVEVELPSWVGLFAPAALPAGSLSTLRAALSAAVRDPAMKTAQAALCNALPGGGSPDFAGSLRAAYEAWDRQLKGRTGG